MYRFSFLWPIHNRLGSQARFYDLASIRAQAKAEDFKSARVKRDASKRPCPVHALAGGSWAKRFLQLYSIRNIRSRLKHR
jgi:hypothetical protein